MVPDIILDSYTNVLLLAASNQTAADENISLLDVLSKVRRRIRKLVADFLPANETREDRARLAIEVFTLALQLATGETLLQELE